GADRFHKIDIARAADSSHFCAERLRDLDGESANAARRPVDQNFLSGLNVSFVAQTLQRSDSGDSDRAGLLERNVGRFYHDRAVGLGANVIRHRSVLRAENFVAWLEIGYIFPNCYDDAGEIGPESRVLGLTHPAHRPHRPRASN